MAKLSKQLKPGAKAPRSTESIQLAIINHHTAAIDIGSMLMMVSYTDAEGNQRLMETDGYTESIKELASTLKHAGVTDVAMEATGIYWTALFEVLEEVGLNVTLINPRHFKNVHAQKTDVNDAQWMHQLHAHGLLRASHIAPDLYRELRCYLHERNRAQQQKSDTLNRIQRTLSQMNLKVQHLLSDIEGVAGMAVLRAIAAGQTDPEALLCCITTKVKASKEDILQSLQGYYKPHFINILQGHLRIYDFLLQEMKQFEVFIESVLQQLLPPDEDGEIPMIPAKKTKSRKNQYRFNLKVYLKKILKVDLTQMDGIDEISVLEIISVTGTDMSKWPTAEHFVSWLNLSPRPKISGGKVLGQQKRFTNNKATQAFRIAAQTMWQSKGPLGNLYKRLAAQKGSKCAVKAIARRIAIIFYNMIKHQTEYNPAQVGMDKSKIEEREIARLKKKAASYGFALQSVANTSL